MPWAEKDLQSDLRQGWICSLETCRRKRSWRRAVCREDVSGVVSRLRTGDHRTLVGEVCKWYFSILKDIISRQWKINHVKLKRPSSLPLMRNLSVWVEFTSIQPWKCLVGLIHKLLCCRNFACLFRKRGPGKYTSNGGPLRVTEVALNSLPIVSNWMDVFTGNPLHGNFVQACFDSYRTGENHATCTPCLFITKK